MAYIKSAGFAPDAEKTADGVWVDCDLLVPTLRGYEALAGDAVAITVTAPSAIAAIGAFTLQDGTNRLVAGSMGAGGLSANLYDVSTAAWTLRNGATGTYTGTADARWTFAQYSNNILAAQRGTQIQYSPDDSQDFTAIGSAPRAAIILSVLDFIMAFNTFDATYGDDPNRWWCSAAGDHTDWTPNIATQATTGLITDGDGPIIAGGRIGSNVVAFTPTSMHLGQYVDAPAVWGFTRVPGDGIGAYSHYSVVNVEGIGLLWPGRDNFYLYDGARAVPIATNLTAEFFLSDLDVANASRMVGFHERSKWRVFWWYPSRGGGLNDGTLDRFLCYNYRSGTWGFGRKTVEFPFEYLTPSVTYGELGSLYTTYADFPNATYGNAFLSAGAHTPSFMGADNVLYSLTGGGNDCWIQTGFIGQDGIIVNMKRLRPRFHIGPSVTGTLEHNYTDQIGVATRQSIAARQLVDGAFDHVWAARWHQARMNFTGTLEVVGFDYEGEPDSLE